MSKIRLDVFMAKAGLVDSRSQAESYIKLGKVKLNSRIADKSGVLVDASDRIDLLIDKQFVSRGGLKVAGAAAVFDLDFNHKTVLDVGSSTGGFSDFALQQGAKKVIAVDVGTNQLHPKLRHDPRVEVYEQTDIRQVKRKQESGNREQGARIKEHGTRSNGQRNQVFIDDELDIILIDVSFISLQEILPAVLKLSQPATQIVAMVKPQFETVPSQVAKGVVKNEKFRRQILKDFENWSKKYFVIINKTDSTIRGEKGNLERFYLLKAL